MAVCIYKNKMYILYYLMQPHVIIFGAPGYMIFDFETLPSIAGFDSLSTKGKYFFLSSPHAC